MPSFCFCTSLTLVTCRPLTSVSILYTHRSWACPCAVTLDSCGHDMAVGDFQWAQLQLKLYVAGECCSLCADAAAAAGAMSLLVRQSTSVKQAVHGRHETSAVAQ